MSKKIMIVEDGAMTAHHLKILLEESGYKPTKPFARGEEAVNYAIDHPVDLILMDIMLAGKIDGITAAEMINRHTEVPVIFLTALTDDETLDRAKLTFPYGFVIKPFDKKELLAMIDTVINKHESTVKQRQFEEARIAALIQGQEMERERISRELHDGLGQMLNAINLNLEYIIKKGGDVKTLSVLINEAISETNRISENMMPSKLNNFSLEECIGFLCAEYKDLIKIDYNHDKLPAGIPGEVKLNIYRIVQELLSNVIQHAQADSVSVQMYGNGEMLTLTVEDDGLGFDRSQLPKETSRGHGVQNIRDRVNMMQGHLKIETSEKFGSMFYIEIPLG